MNCLKRFLGWVVKSEPQGLGTLLLGIAAVVASFQASSLLDRVLEIQNQAKEIKVAIEILSSEVRAKVARARVEDSKALKNINATRVDIEGEIGRLPINLGRDRIGVFLPKYRINETVEKIYKSDSVEDRIQILKESLEYGNIDEIDWMPSAASEGYKGIEDRKKEGEKK